MCERWVLPLCHELPVRSAVPVSRGAFLRCILFRGIGCRSRLMPLRKAELAIVFDAGFCNCGAGQLNWIATFDGIHEQCLDSAGNTASSMPIHAVRVTIAVQMQIALLAEVPVAEFANWSTPSGSATEFSWSSVIAEKTPYCDPNLPIEKWNSDHQCDHQCCVYVIFVWHVHALVIVAENVACAFQR